MDDFDGYYSLDEVCALFANVKRPTIARWERDLGFPPRTYLGKKEPTSSKSKYGEPYTARSKCRIGYDKVKVRKWAQSRPVADPKTILPDEEE